jgi:RimJ/RimL family protein N-acetyltransferase
MTFRRRKTGFRVCDCSVHPSVSSSCSKGCHERDNNWNFVIELLPTSNDDPSSSSPRVIGMIGAVRAPEVGYMLNANYWGRGYATEALRGFMPLFFDHFSGGEHERYEYAVALTDTELVSSQNVLSKVGFRLHEKREKDFDNPVLGLRDTLVYQMLRPEPVHNVP